MKRYLASLVVLARDNGLSEGTARRAVQSGLRAYRNGISHYATAGEYSRSGTTSSRQATYSRCSSRRSGSESRRDLAKRARRRTSAGAARKLTRVVDGRTADRRRSADPGATRRQGLRRGFRRASRARSSRPITTACRTNAATCSTGSPSSTWSGRSSASAASACRCTWCCWRAAVEMIRCSCRSSRPGRRCTSSTSDPARIPNHGQRVITGKRLIQAASDIFVGWTRVRELDFYVRQFRDMKVIADGQTIAPYLVHFAGQCGARARTSTRSQRGSGGDSQLYRQGTALRQGDGGIRHAIRRSNCSRPRAAGRRRAISLDELSSLASRPAARGVTLRAAVAGRSPSAGLSGT